MNTASSATVSLDGPPGRRRAVAGAAGASTGAAEVAAGPGPDSAAAPAVKGYVVRIFTKHIPK